MNALRWSLVPVQAVAPELAARLAERIFFTPPQTPASPAVRAFLASGAQFRTPLPDGGAVVGWRWGSGGGPTVYLMHGWGGRGGRLGAFAPPLLAAGCDVVTFDAPGHGHSGSGMTSMPQFARALLAVVEGQGPAHAVIAHSLGCAATALAATWGLDAKRLVFLAPPVDPAAWAAPFARALGLKDHVMARMRARSERRIRFRWADLDVRAMARRVSLPLLVVHDVDDETVAYDDGAAIAAAWPGARLVTTRGLGHRGVTREPDVVQEVAAFATAGRVTAGADSESARVERELFHRELRWARLGRDGAVRERA